MRAEGWKRTATGPHSRGVRSRTRRTGRAALALACASLTTGCAQIEVKTETIDTPVREFKSQKIDGPVTYRVAASTVFEPDGHGLAKVSFRFEQFKPCTLVEHRVVDRTVETRKGASQNATRMMWLFGIMGGLTAATGGALVAAGNDPKGAEWEKARVETGAGIAAIGGVMLLPVLIDAIRLADSSDHPGQVTIDGPRQASACEVAPAGNVPVIVTRGAEVLSGRADASGKLDATIDLGKLTTGDGTTVLTVAGRVVDVPKDLPEAAKTFAEGKQKRETERIKAESSWTAAMGHLGTAKFFLSKKAFKDARAGADDCLAIVGKDANITGPAGAEVPNDCLTLIQQIDKDELADVVEKVTAGVTKRRWDEIVEPTRRCLQLDPKQEVCERARPLVAKFEARRLLKEAAAFVGQRQFAKAKESAEACLKNDAKSGQCTRIMEKAEREIAHLAMLAARMRPHHVKDFVVYEEGGGFKYYAVLVNDRDEQVRAAGTLRIAASCVLGHGGSNQALDTIQPRRINPSDFKSATVGLGAFQRPALVVDGWIQESSLLSAALPMAAERAPQMLRGVVSQTCSYLRIYFAFRPGGSDQDLTAKTDLHL